MALREIDERGRLHDAYYLPHEREFDAVWLSMTARQPLLKVDGTRE